MGCAHDELEVVVMAGKRVVWASDHEPLDPQPTFTECAACGQVFVRMTKQQDEIVRFCMTLGTPHMRILVDAPADE